MKLKWKSMRNKKNGFTLTEVLMTISILGVIAMAVLPVVIQNFQKSQIESKFRMAYSILSRAIELSEVYTGPSATWSYGSNVANEAQAKSFAETYLIPNLNVLYICNTSGTKKCFAGKGDGKEDGWYDSAGKFASYDSYGRKDAYAFRMKNGMSIAVNSIDSESAVIKFTVDIDGPTKGKSIMGRDVFLFTLGAINPDTGSRLGLIPGITNGSGQPIDDLPCKGAENGSDSNGYCGTTHGCGCAVSIVHNDYKLPYKITEIATTYKE